MEILREVVKAEEGVPTPIQYAPYLKEYIVENPLPMLAGSKEKEQMLSTVFTNLLLRMERWRKERKKRNSA